MKRTDFDPHGERNCANRGISGYERISWDEALDIVAEEIQRVKRHLRSRGDHERQRLPPHLGQPGLLAQCQDPVHEFHRLTAWSMHNPDSWEGWYWGAMHHWGNSIRNGGTDTYGTVEDCLKEAELIVFWSSDPEATSGVYGAFEGTVRRQWAKELGIQMVHIDPYFNHTVALFGGKWIAPRPDTGNAMALAIAHVWITENLYDKDYVQDRTVGFEKWREYILGKTDGIPKTPEWQEAETNVPARDVRALAQGVGNPEDLPVPRGACGLRGGLPLRYGNRMGAVHGLPHGDAGAWENPGSIWGVCSRARRWTPISTSRGMRRAVFRAIWTIRDCG